MWLLVLMEPLPLPNTITIIKRGHAQFCPVKAWCWADLRNPIEWSMVTRIGERFLNGMVKTRPWAEMGLHVFLANTTVPAQNNSTK